MSRVRLGDGMVNIDDARAIAATLPRSTEAVVRYELKFRIGRIVYVAFSRDATIMGFAFPKDFRAALVASAPHKLLLPRQSDLRFHWVCVRLDKISKNELRELIVSAWRMCVPKKVAAAYDGLATALPASPPPTSRPRRKPPPQRRERRPPR